jgi:hypothetical protein
MMDKPLSPSVPYDRKPCSLSVEYVDILLLLRLENKQGQSLHLSESLC